MIYNEQRNIFELVLSPEEQLVISSGYVPFSDISRVFFGQTGYILEFPLPLSATMFGGNF